MEYTLLWVVDVQLLQEQAVVQEAAPHFGQELQDDSSLGSQENHGVVAMRAGGVIHGDTRETVSDGRRVTMTLPYDFRLGSR